VEALEDRCLLAQVTEFSTGITLGSGLQGITRGEDGNLWFAEENHDALGRITPDGKVTEFSLASLGAIGGPVAITSGPGGLLYFTLFQQIGSINPLLGTDAAILASLTPSKPTSVDANLQGITAGPDGNLWFTEHDTNQIGSVGPNLATATIHEFPLPQPSSSPYGITAGPDGALWFTEQSGNRIGRITTAGTVTNQFTLPGTNSAPIGITSGPDGNLWFTDAVNQIGQISRSGTIHTFPLPTGHAGLAITAGPDGNLWFTDGDNTEIGRISTAGTVIEYSMGITGVGVGIVTGPDGNLWFTETSVNKVGRLIPDLTATGTPVTAIANFPFGGVVASFTAADTFAVPGDFAVTINWGDGTPPDTTSGTVAAVPNQPGHFAVNGSHTYAAAGSDTIVVTVASQLADVGDVQVLYNARNTFTDFPDYNVNGTLNGEGVSPDGPVFVVANTSGTDITGAVLSINPPGGPADSFQVGTVPAGGHVFVEPGVSADGGTNHTFFKVTGSDLDTSELAVSADATQFELTGVQNGKVIDSGVFTPAATRGPSNDGLEASINFLGNEDAPCTDCFGPKVVATLFGPSPSAGPPSATATAFSPATVVPFANSVDLGVQETGPSRATAGGDSTFTLTLTNAGPADAQAVTLTDAVPAGTTFVSATQTSGPTFNLTTPQVGGTGTVTANNGTLTASQVATFQVVFQAGATMPIVNTAVAATSTPNRNPHSMAVPPPVPVQLTLSASTVADGSPPGTEVGTLIVSLPAALAGQFLPPIYGLPAGEADNAAFALAATASGETLLTQFQACAATQASYQVSVHIDVGFRDQVVTLPVTIVAGANPCMPGAGVPVLESVRVLYGGQGQALNLVLAFSTALDPGSVTSLGHYAVRLGFTGKGRHRRPITAPVLAATYDPVQKTVTLRLGRVKGPRFAGTLMVEDVLGLDGVLGNAAVVSVNLRPKPAHKH
jgi:uncharacterized repeat protein (TIGR01451 family)